MLFLPAVLFILLGITGKKAESITELVRPAAGEKEEDVSFTVKPGGMEK